ncbi:MAG: YEATS-associated helix-containing protein [Lentilitoribacter sp.]
MLESFTRYKPVWISMAVCVIIYLGSLFWTSPNRQPETVGSISFLIVLLFIAYSVGLLIHSAEAFKNLFTRVISIVLVLLTLFLLTCAILEFGFLPFSNFTVHAKEAQILLAVTSAGMLGGLMKYLTEFSNEKTEQYSLWGLIQSSITGLFVALVLFLILRAGIINQTNVDTFNIWGVSGVSCVTGFFANKVLERLSSVYEELAGLKRKETQGED